MKKFILIPAIAAFTLTGCSNDTNKPQDNSEENGVRSYLNVTLVAPKGNTRAANYEDGDKNENNINSVRFYFFDEAGDAVEVFKQTASKNYLSYIDWIPTDADLSSKPETGQTIEKIANATLGINMPSNNNGFPALVVAVINPPADLLALQGNPNLTTLRNQVADYLTGLTDNNFIITNSVYEDEGDIVDATVINPDCYSQNPDEVSTPLYIYVERVVARLDLSIEIENGIEMSGANNDSFYIYPLKEYTIGGTPTNIYVKLLGWNVTATPGKSRLIKKIDTDWDKIDPPFGDPEPWNDATYHRSFWAINPPSSQYSYQYGNYNGLENNVEGNYFPANALPIPDPGKSSITYLQENAAFLASPDAASQERVYSKVILAAQLVDETGNSMPIANWANRYYTPTGVKDAACNTLNLYQKTIQGESTKFTKITPDQLDMVAATDLYGENLPDGVSSYDVFLQLTEKASAITWYNGNTTTSPQLNTDQTNTYILDRIGYIYVWNEGMTYYYFDIRHLGAEGFPGYWGVVRNHIYRANITSIAGLGTPVYDPDEVIYPEMPGYDDSVISAVVSIINWRIVSSNYEIKWP